LSDDVLEKEFVKSWNRMEWFFGSGEACPKRPDAVDFIRTLRRMGYDRKLRAGQSIDIFIVSRSRKHGLEPEQARIEFYIYEGKMHVQGKIDVDSRGLPQTEAFIENTQPVSDHVRDLLDRLSNGPIT